MIITQDRLNISFADLGTNLYSEYHDNFYLTRPVRCVKIGFSPEKIKIIYCRNVPGVVENSDQVKLSYKVAVRKFVERVVNKILLNDDNKENLGINQASIAYFNNFINVNINNNDYLDSGIIKTHMYILQRCMSDFFVAWSVKNR